MLSKTADFRRKSSEMKERHFIQSQVRLDVTSRQSIKIKSEQSPTRDRDYLEKKKKKKKKRNLFSQVLQLSLSK